jgi:N-acetylglutamate synthase-like GNAT family acetyltransferase
MIRAFKNTDTNAVLELFDQNVPAYFNISERTDLNYYLENEVEDYFVLDLNGLILGCGGINYRLNEEKAFISWDIIHPDHHGKGFGRMLTEYRLTLIKQRAHISKIIVRTSQFTSKFYEKMGFELIETQKDFWAPGIDLYYMQISLI